MVKMTVWLLVGISGSKITDIFRSVSVGVESPLEAVSPFCTFTGKVPVVVLLKEVLAPCVTVTVKV